MSFVGTQSSAEASSITDHPQPAAFPPATGSGRGRPDRGTASPTETRWPVNTPKMRVAIVHEWLETYGGSERVLEQLLQCFPSADVFAVVDFMPEKERGFLRGRTVRTSFIQRLPGARRMFRHYLGLMPIAIEQYDLGGYDLILSSSHAVAKGVITGPDQIHISYVHSPMRYIWDLQHQYLDHAGLRHGLKAMYVKWLFGRLREWDVSSSHHVDHFIANSHYIARRIQKAYRRDASIIHPPVDIDTFRPGNRKDDFFLMACRFVPYKQVEIVVESFRQQPHRRLIVVGNGPETARVHAAAQGAGNITFKGVVPKPELVDLMQRARAVVYAAEEDFGITMAEAQACGTPVIAYGRGGAADIVITDPADSPTGVLFHQQDAAAVTDAIRRFETIAPEITSEACRANAMRFSRTKFRAEIHAFVNQALAQSWRFRLPESPLAENVHAPVAPDADGEASDPINRTAERSSRYVVAQ